MLGAREASQYHPGARAPACARFPFVRELRNHFSVWGWTRNFGWILDSFGRVDLRVP